MTPPGGRGARARLAAAAAAAALGGCAMFGGPEAPKPAPLPALAHPHEVRLIWSAQVGGAGTFVFFPAFVDGAVFAAAHDGTVARFDAATGAERWRKDLHVPLSAGVGADDSTVAVATRDGVVYALDAKTGAERWRAAVSSTVLAPPAVAGNLVVARSIDNRVFAFEAADGKRRWVYQRAAASLILRAPSGPTIDGDSVLVGFSGGKMAALATDNGGVRWEATVAEPRGATELERLTDVVGDPAVAGPEVCAAAYQGRLACFESASGRPEWARPASSFTGVSLDARYAYLSDDHDAVLAYDRSDGQSVWKQDKLAHHELTLPYPDGELIAVGDVQGYVHFLSRESGAFVARRQTDGSPIRAAPIGIPGGVLVQTHDGELAALAP